MCRISENLDEHAVIRYEDVNLVLCEIRGTCSIFIVLYMYVSTCNKY